MASKAANTAEATETREEAADAPLLDTLAAAIKKILARGKERGYLTYDELNAALPHDQVSSEQIEDSMMTTSVAPMIPFACICERWVQLSCYPGKGRLRSLSGSRPVAR